MSFRPSIAVYARGKIMDIRFYPEFRTQDLLCEAVALWALYGDCPDRRTYLHRRYGAKRIRYKDEEEVTAASLKNLQLLETLSELPLILDLTSQSIYVGIRAKSPAELRALPRLTVKEFRASDLGSLLPHRRLDLSWASAEVVLRALRNWDRADRHLSQSTCRKLKKQHNGRKTEELDVFSDLFLFTK